MNVSDENFSVDQVYYTDNYSPFPVSWLIIVIIAILIIFIVLFFFFRQRTQLIDPINCPQVRSRYAVHPSVTKTALRSCGTNQNEPCHFPASSLSQAIDLCETNSSFCSEFSYDPISHRVTFVNPTGNITSTQQENLYLRQIGGLITIN